MELPDYEVEFAKYFESVTTGNFLGWRSSGIDSSNLVMVGLHKPVVLFFDTAAESV